MLVFSFLLLSLVFLYMFKKESCHYSHFIALNHLTVSRTVTAVVWKFCRLGWLFWLGVYVVSLVVVDVFASRRLEILICISCPYKCRLWHFFMPIFLSCIFLAGCAKMLICRKVIRVFLCSMANVLCSSMLYLSSICPLCTFSCCVVSFYYNVANFCFFFLFWLHIPKEDYHLLFFLYLRVFTDVMSIG